MQNPTSVFDAKTALDEASERVIRYAIEQLNIKEGPLKDALIHWKSQKSENEKSQTSFGPLMIEPGFRPQKSNTLKEIDYLEEETKEVIIGS